MKVFRATDKQYNAEYHLYEMAEAIKELSKDDLQELVNASPVFEDAVHLANRLGKYQAEQFEALVKEVAPMQKLRFEVKVEANKDGDELYYELIKKNGYSSISHPIEDKHMPLIMKILEKGKVLRLHTSEQVNFVRKKVPLLEVFDNGSYFFAWVAQEEESEQEKPIFEEMPFCTKEFIENAIDCTGDSGNIPTIQGCIDYLEQGRILLLSLVSFENLKSHLGSGTYCFYESKELKSNKSCIVLWKFKAIGSEQTKPIFEEVSIDLKPASGFSYLGVRSSDDGHFYKILHIIENDHRCVCVHAHIFVELKKMLKGENYLFCQSKCDDELIVWIWKAAT